MRAWCAGNGDYRDFALSRIEVADWRGVLFTAPVVDEEWERMETVTLRPHSGLDEEQRKGIIHDYGLKGGELRVKVRAAIKEYFLAQWRVPEPQRPAHLEISNFKFQTSRKNGEL